MTWKTNFHKIERKLVNCFPKKPFSVNRAKPVISFSFDDFPVSAIKGAGEILTQHGMTATYFVASGLISQNVDGIDICAESDIRDAFDEGHEIGCHTFGHLDCQNISDNELKQDLEENSRQIEKIVGIAPSSFAYPFGKISFRARNIVRDTYPVARGIGGGINSRRCDLLNLKANSVYSSSFSLERIRKLLSSVQESNGWLVFYTHDVSENPSDFGCTIDEFRALVEMVSETGITVMPIKHALGLVSFTQNDSDGQ